MYRILRITGASLFLAYQRKTSTSHALYMLRSTVDYFNNRGSKVFVAFLDCTKAFDRISHYGLFTHLINRKIPLCILLCLIFWYMNMTCMVHWGSEMSRSFCVPLGVKQGGINSPEFFAIYYDGLIKMLRKAKIGCHMFNLFVAVILFADDICLLAPTHSALSKMIEICTNYCKQSCFSFNPKRSKIVVFSRKKLDHDQMMQVTLQGKVIDYVQSIKYLGTTICSNGGFSFSATHELCNFYRASNAILNVLNKPNENVLMHLLYTNCVPILTYACSIKSFSSKDMGDCTTALNDAIWKIFSFNWWESVRSLRETFGYYDTSFPLFAFFAITYRAFRSECRLKNLYYS